MPIPQLDPNLVEPLRTLMEVAPEVYTRENIAMVRDIFDSVSPTNEHLSRGGRLQVEERTIPGPPGAPDLEILVIRDPAVTILRPGILHIHGGGTIAANLRIGLDGFVRWVDDPGMVVVSTSYRLSPEHPYPAQLEDCRAALEWVADHAEELGIDRRLLVIGGASAGGGLSATLALHVRDFGGPEIAGQMLMFPMLDSSMSTPSTLDMSGPGHSWNNESHVTAWSCFLGDLYGTADIPQYASASRATDLSNLPPALLDVGTVDVIRDETVDYASRIWQAGGSAELHVWPGGFHGSEDAAPELVMSRATWDARTNWLGRFLALRAAAISS